MKFANIYSETEENMRLALLSLWTPANHPMRSTIDNLLKKEPLVAEPVFQSTFGWEQTEGEGWKNYLNEQVIQKLKIGDKYPPYRHQAESWKALKEGKSIVVTSGTGSGKTECFMYPVINDLYEQPKTNSIQAIFLYPLNALMEDQKKRLSEFCEKTGLNFAVYNGDTPEYRSDAADTNYPNEVSTREEIRDSQGNNTRPQILLSNPSMLEYILVRKSDQKMIQESAGKLRWIIIDEAHSYSGSSAVELSFQIKRILDAFKVNVQDVRFACTSATIGGESGKETLKKFISTITGQPLDKIQIIGGNRIIPEVDRDTLTKKLQEDNLPDINRVISLRRKINQVPGMSLRQMWEHLFPDKIFEAHRALKVIDKLTELKIDDAAVLSLRAHFFMRSVNGIYACANDNCTGSTGTPYGYLTTFKGTICPHCGAPLLEILQCKRCNSFILSGQSNAQTHAISAREERFQEDDYFSISNPDDEEELGNNYYGSDFFLLPYNRDSMHNPVSEANSESVDIIFENNIAYLEPNINDSGKWFEVQKNDGHAFCPSCGQIAQGTRLHFKHFRIPINFMNQIVAPVFLHECAQNGHTWGKYIAFTDSRQGTAISAKTFNINVERTQCREKTMQLLASRSDSDKIFLERLRKEVPGLSDEVYQQIIQAQNGDRNNISLTDLSEQLFNENIFHHISEIERDRYNENQNAYKAALMRSFIGRRPLYDSNIETMGLITLTYPGIRDIRMPSSLMDYMHQHGITLDENEWHNYLKILLDFYVRVRNCIQPRIPNEKKYVREHNQSKPFCSSDDIRDNVVHWPKVKFKSDHSISKYQSQMILLLCAGLRINSFEELETEANHINNILNDALQSLIDRNVLREVRADDEQGYNNPRYYENDEYVGCFYLDLSDKVDNHTAVIKRTQEAWICPVTGQLLDTTFCGYSPLMVGELSSNLFEKYRCTQKVIMPERPADNDSVNEWLETDENVQHLKEAGLWTDRHKETYKYEPAYIAAEHSAQQSKYLLRKYVEGFSQNNPTINVLQCSTTMEMGVDIGSIDTVLMDTIPPTAANYMQRVGRAGRMGQSRAVAFSLCNNTPVGQYAFANPMWALETSNDMISVRSSQTIVQRHINSYFFRKYICDHGQGITATLSIDDFMSESYARFTQFLDTISTDRSVENEFHAVFGQDVRFTIDVTRNTIVEIHDNYQKVIQELNEALQRHQNEVNRKQAIARQIERCKDLNLLSYLSENQFFPNANMPTGIVTFEFIDKDKVTARNILKNEIDKLREELKNDNVSDARKIIIEDLIGKKRKKINQINRETTASRDIRTALNEYAPEQTVVVNEKNYISAGVVIYGVYNDQTQTKGIYHCTHCGHTEYSPNLDEHRRCPTCGNQYRGIIDRDHTTYTRAYEPVGFKTDVNVSSTREEQTEKRFYDIRPVLLNTDWTNPITVNRCEIKGSGGNGSILFYNVGNGNGFAFCKRCGRAAVEAMDGELPHAVRTGHHQVWGDLCDATEQDVLRNVVLTGRHQTCYAAMRFIRDKTNSTFETDEELAYSLGVILTRALAKSEGIDETEVDFGVKQEENAWVLFIYDTARGGCGYSLKFTDPDECQKIFELAKKELEETPCNCHKDGGACTSCLIDRNNYRYADKLSKAKALNWLKGQQINSFEIPEIVRSSSPEARTMYQNVKLLVQNAVNSNHTQRITFCVSDNIDDLAITDWSSSKSEMGKMLRRAIDNGIEVSIKVEYHPDFHIMLIDKIPFIDLENRFPDCDIDLVNDLGPIKTLLIIEDENGTKRYFTDQQEVMSFSNNWGNECDRLFIDNLTPDFISCERPRYQAREGEIIRQGLTEIENFKVANYFKDVIAKATLQPDDLDIMQDILFNKKIEITFSDMYVNSALASLMLVYLIKQMKDLFKFEITKFSLHLNSKRRKCSNESFNETRYIFYNFENENDADTYTDDLIEKILNINAEHPDVQADHHRWLRLENENGDVVEIRPDHGISGGWKSFSSYINRDCLDGNVEVYKDDTDILYYVLMRKKDN